MKIENKMKMELSHQLALGGTVSIRDWIVIDH